MISPDNVQLINQDVSKAIEVLTKQEEYEAVGILSDCQKDFKQYLCGSLDLEEIYVSLLTVCIFRYPIHRLIQTETAHIASFIIPSLDKVIFRLSGDYSQAWQDLQLRWHEDTELIKLSASEGFNSF